MSKDNKRATISISQDNKNRLRNIADEDISFNNIVAYLKRWKGTPLNEAIGVGGLFDITPYIYQATDQLNFYEWKIANCYVGMLVQDTGDGVEENAPLYAETYVMQRRINTFYK